MIKEIIIKDLYNEYAHKPHRLAHVLGVRDTAITLGEKYQLDTEKLELAALLHDITKYYPNNKNIELIKSYFDNAEEIIQEYNPHILHAFSAVVVVKKKYKISDKDVLDAIMHHTVGKKQMTLYEKIIFISDYIEPNRTYEACKKVREIAFDNLDLAVYQAINNSITFFEKEGGQVPKTAYEARDYYYEILGGNV